jgi:putative Mg2+ transporter-C (MgtC) family protein
MEANFELAAIGRIALAGLLGGLIGLEREFAHKPAGLRTHIFVASASALLVILSDGIMDAFRQEQMAGFVMADPIRIVQAIVIGISFLGAGTIIHHRKARVEGLTTAASIFLTAGIGIAVAIGRPVLAAETTAFALIVLLAVGWIERRFRRRRHLKRPPAAEHEVPQ